MDYPLQDSEDFILTFETFFKFDVFVPEGMRQEVETDGIGSTFKKSMGTLGQYSFQLEGKGIVVRVEWGKNGKKEQIRED